MPPNPPIPTQAEYNALLGRIEVRFDSLLVPGATALNNWYGVALFGGQKRTLIQSGPGVLVDGWARIPVTRDALAIGPSFVNYYATPADVVSHLTGVAAWPFHHFPMIP